MKLELECTRAILQIEYQEVESKIYQKVETIHIQTHTQKHT